MKGSSSVMCGSCGTAAYRKTPSWPPIDAKIAVAEGMLRITRFERVRQRHTDSDGRVWERFGVLRQREAPTARNKHYRKGAISQHAIERGVRRRAARRIYGF